MEKPVLKSGPEQSVESLKSDMADIREQLRFIMEQDGLYRPLWQWYKNHEGDDEITTTMKKVEQFYSRFSDLDHRLATGKEVSKEDREAIKQLIANMPKLMDALSKAEILVTKADDKKGEGVSDALAVLRAMKEQYSPEEWAKAQKKVSPALKKGWISGETSVLDQIGAMFNEYVSMWKGLGTDGLKGVAMKQLREMEMLRLKIAHLIAKCGDIYLQAMCSEGTSFYEHMQKLASQECGSRDVQNLVGWWEKAAKKG